FRRKAALRISEGCRDRCADENWGKVENAPKCSRDCRFDIAHLRSVWAELLFERGHYHAVDATGNNKVEVLQVGRDVEGKPVPGDPVTGMNTDRRNLSSPGPHTSKTDVTLCG